MHVADRVERDKRSDSCDEQEHDAGKPIEQESDIHMQKREIDPVAEGFTESRFRHSTGQDRHAGKGHGRENDGKSTHDVFGCALLATGRNDSNRTEENRSQQGEQGNEPQR